MAGSGLVAGGVSYGFERQAASGLWAGRLAAAVGRDVGTGDVAVTQTSFGGACLPTMRDGRDGPIGRLGASLGLQRRDGWTLAGEVGGLVGGEFREISVGLRAQRLF